MYYLIFLIPFILALSYELLKVRQFTPYSLLLVLVVFTAVSSLIVRPDFDVNSVQGYILTVFTVVVLAALVFSFHSLSGVRAVQKIDPRKLRKFKVFTFFFSAVGFVLTLYISIVSILYFRFSSFGISEYKNGDIAQEYLANVVPGWMYTLMGVTMPFAFLALGLHFYHLAQKESKLSILPLILSFSIPIGSFHEFSRGRLLMFIILYLILFLYLRRALPSPSKRVIRRSIFVIGTPILVLLTFISVNRFGASKYSNVDEGMNPVVVSLLDYSGQWHENNMEVLKVYEPSKNMKGSRFRYFTRRFERLFGVKTVEQFDLDIEVFGKYGTQFRGIVSNLVYDLGYIGTVIFVFFFRRISRRARPHKSGQVNFSQILLFISLSLPIAFFFQGNIIVLSFISTGMLYMYFSHVFFKFRFK